MRYPRWAAALAVLTAVPAFAGSNLRGNGKNLSWKDGKVVLRVSRTVHTASGEFGVDKRESAESVHSAVMDAIRAWTGPGRAKVELDLAFTDAQTVNSGENIVTFTDPAPFDTGLCNKDTYISCTLVSFTEDGAIAGASVAFNPYKRHSSIGLEGTHDVGLMMMHEMGHVLGIDHSMVADSVMLAAAEQEPSEGAPRQFAVRRLSEDDLSMLAGIYPLGPVSGASGKVTRGGAGVAGARVIALDQTGRVPHGVVTGEDGSFRLLLGPGSYTISAEPSDGPVAIANGQVVVAEGSWVEAVEISAAAGPKLTVDNVGVIVGGLYAGMPHVDLARGRDHSLALSRSPVGSVVELVLPEPAVMRNGNATSPSSAPQLVRQPVRVAAEAPTGSFGFAARTGLTFTVLPGSLRLVNNPKIDALEDVETGEPVTSLRVGRRYRLRGVDFASETLTAAPAFEGATPPTQLAGIVVRVAGRYLPLLSVSPAEIVFEVPPFPESADTTLAIVTGTMMESDALKVQVALE